MRQLGWIALAALLAAGAMLTVAWPAIEEYHRMRTLNVERSDQPAGTLEGVSVRVDSSRQHSFPQRPDRTVIWLRLGIGGAPAARAAWLGCDLALTDGAGRRWLPLPNRTGDQIVSFLSGKPALRNCDRALLDGEAEALSDQAFLVPSDVADRLRVELSGLMVRTTKLSLPLAVPQTEAQTGSATVQD